MNEVSEKDNHFETRETLEKDWNETDTTEEIEEQSPQEIAANIHMETKEHVAQKYGECMTYDRIKELQSSESLEQLKVISAEEYQERFPTMPYGVLGHCDPEGNIYIKERSPADVKHITVHETMHLASEKDVMHSEGGDVYVSGLREIKSQESTIISDKDRGINEGTTEMYTLRELLDQGEDAHSISAYSESRMWMERIEGLVGEKRLAEAYFGGKKDELEKEFNRLNNNNENAWTEFSKDIDILEYGKNEAECIEARTRIAMRYNEMINEFYGLEE